MSTICWTDAHTTRHARWHSENATPPPEQVVLADDRTRASTAYRLAREGTALLWQGDYHNARQLLRALSRRVEKTAPPPGTQLPEAFHRWRSFRSYRSGVLGRLVVLLDDDYALNLRRAPDVRQACTEAYGPPREPMVVALTELLGVIGAHQWRLNGVPVPALGARIHPHYGVFSPTRVEYVDLLARAPLPAPAPSRAFDVGTGTGVLAAVLARRGVGRVTATDTSMRALACARENVERLGLADRVDVTGPAFFPQGRAGLVVCNPPWVPASPTSAVEQGVYDPDSRMLHGFLDGLAAHLEPGGEGWLVLSDLAERLGLRSRQELPALVEAAGLRVVDRITTGPRQSRPADAGDPLAQARAAETISLWRLACR